MVAVDAVLLIIGALFLGAGIVGCILPVLPGPPLSYVALLLQWWVSDPHPSSYGWTTVIILGLLAAGVTALDFLAPVYGAKRYGASKAGLWGSILGLLVGMIWFPPFGMIVGAFVGALGGEWFAGKTDGEAMKAAWGVFIGTMAGVVLKLVVCIAITFYFVRELWA